MLKLLCFSNDGVYVGVGMITGSVAVYIAFSLQVSTIVFGISVECALPRS